jgi:hypothetical protein
MNQESRPETPSERAPRRPGVSEWGRVIRRNLPSPPESAVKPELLLSPLTDPRALGSSFLFHLLLLAVLSLAAFRVGMPAETQPPTALRGDLGPVDNRAKDDTGGGGPGELGGTDTIRISADGRAAQSQTVQDPAADALLSEILPAPASADAAQRALPGPLTTGLGVVPGPGQGGGGGSGGGSGGGIGRGIGPGTEFFGAREHAGSFAYVIDCSGSMAVHKSLDVAKRELLASLGQLPPDAKFGVIFYNLDSVVLTDAVGKEALMEATSTNKSRVRSRLATILPDGGTDHMTALRAALKLKPEVIFFLTDADLMSRKDVEEIVAEAGTTRIQAVEFGLGPQGSDASPLRRLATGTGGSYRYIDVTKFPKANG